MGRVIGCHMSALQDIYTRRCRTRTERIIRNLNQPNNRLLSAAIREEEKEILPFGHLVPQTVTLHKLYVNDTRYTVILFIITDHTVQCPTVHFYSIVYISILFDLFVRFIFILFMYLLDLFWSRLTIHDTLYCVWLYLYCNIKTFFDFEALHSVCTHYTFPKNIFLELKF